MMRVSIERLRVWLLVGAGLLVVVIAAFLGYAHVRAHRFLRDLPGRLGADITRESNGFTYSQSSKGKTVYTIHASKMVQRKDGKTTLHDVGIVLYGQKEDRADRIYGSEFEYDQRAGVVRAMGEVHLDLGAPAPANARERAEYAAGKHVAEPAGSGGGRGGAAGAERMVHVTTSGLVFVQSLGAASTDREIEFEYRGMKGRAKGANYNSDTGITVLQSDVQVTGVRDGEPVELTARHAEMDRGKGELRLLEARYVAGGEGAAGGEGKTAKERERRLSAADAVVHLRVDGSVERVVAGGGVSLEQAGGVLRGRDAEVSVDAENRPEVARVSGGLTFTEDGLLRQVEGRAGHGVARFDGAGRVKSAVMTDAAEVHMRERAAGTEMWSERTISGGEVTVNFAIAGGGRAWVHDGRSVGGARMLLVDRAGLGAGPGAGPGARPSETTTELRGDMLTAEMVWDGRATRLSHVGGVGHTALRRSDSNGAEDTSSGETLEVSFGTAAAGGSKDVARTGAGGVGTAGRVLSAVERGGVTLTHLPGRRVGVGGSAAGASAGGAAPAASDMVRASAAQAVFAGDGQVLTLSGQAQVTEGESLVRAETVVMRQGTGDATAVGRVSVSYRQAGSAEPVHVVAERAEFRKETGRATFFGVAGVAGAGGGAGSGLARMWQGASQVEAPVIEFSQAEKVLVASSGGAGAGAVRTVLVSGRGGERPQVMRISSGSLRYSDAERRAQFGGGVVLESAEGTVRGAQVVALLRPVVPAGAAGAVPVTGRAAGSVGGSVGGDRVKAGGGVGSRTGFMGGGVDRVTAEGGVEVSEPGRRATGERLVYTAADGMFVMTGTPGIAPEVVDEAQGTITGSALEFHAGDNSVMVLGNAKGETGRRVRTETQVQQRP